MARIRTIKPEFFSSADIVSLSPLARLFYVSLWCEADREGRMEWKPATFKLRYLPGDQVAVAELAAELTSAGLVTLYDIDGVQYAEIPTFAKHQVINNREASSTLPARVVTREPRVKAKLPRDQAEGKEGRKGTSRAAGFDDFWNSWPKNDRKQDRSKCAEKWEAQGLEPLLPVILADIEVKKHTDKWQGGFIEAPLVYLNNRRWEDGVTGEAGQDPGGFI